MVRKRTHLIQLAIFSLFIALPGCTTLFSAPQRGSSSSLVDYLYPDGVVPERQNEALPYLELPLKIGIAFVPSRTERYGFAASNALTEVRRAELLEKVSDAFKDADYVDSIEIIPSMYLAKNTGFEALRQVGRIYDLDVFALVSWDQMTTTDDTRASLLYWTIVGAYVIEASRNEVHTLLDTAVFDLRTETLLLRAPGADRASKKSTAVEVASATRSLASESFERAVADMIENLESESLEFGQRAEEGGVADIAYSENYRGSSISMLLLLILMAGLLFLCGRVGKTRA